jgi:hypothetical protein
MLSLPGPPLSEKSALVTLLDAGVNTALGVVDEAEARNTLFELAWVGFLTSNLCACVADTIVIGFFGLKRNHFQTQSTGSCVDEFAQGVGI